MASRQPKAADLKGAAELRDGPYASRTACALLICSRRHFVTIGCVLGGCPACCKGGSRESPCLPCRTRIDAFMDARRGAPFQWLSSGDSAAASASSNGGAAPLNLRLPGTAAVKRRRRSAKSMEPPEENVEGAAHAGAGGGAAQPMADDDDGSNGHGAAGAGSGGFGQHHAAGPVHGEIGDYPEDAAIHQGAVGDDEQMEDGRDYGGDDGRYNDMDDDDGYGQHHPEFDAAKGADDDAEQRGRRVAAALAGGGAAHVAAPAAAAPAAAAAVPAAAAAAAAPASTSYPPFDQGCRLQLPSQLLPISTRRCFSGSVKEIVVAAPDLFLFKKNLQCQMEAGGQCHNRHADALCDCDGDEVDLINANTPGIGQKLKQLLDVRLPVAELTDEHRRCTSYPTAALASVSATGLRQSPVFRKSLLSFASSLASPHRCLSATPFPLVCSIRGALPTSSLRTRSCAVMGGRGTSLAAAARSGRRLLTVLR